MYSGKIALTLEKVTKTPFGAVAESAALIMIVPSEGPLASSVAFEAEAF